MAIQSISTHGDPEHTLVLARALPGARSAFYSLTDPEGWAVGLDMLAAVNALQKLETCQKRACQTIANLTAKTTDHIQSVIDADVLTVMLEFIPDEDRDLHSTAVDCFRNIADHGTPEQIRHIVEDLPLAPAIFDLLQDRREWEYVSPKVWALLRALLDAGERVMQRYRLAANPYVSVFLEHDPGHEPGDGEMSYQARLAGHMSNLVARSIHGTLFPKENPTQEEV